MNTIRTPFIKSDRAAFWVVFLAGLALCTRGIGQAPVYGWLHPISILGYVFGALAMLLGLSVLFRIRITPLTTDRAALVALLSIIAVKFILATFYPIIP